MKFLVDANVLSEPTKAAPDPRVVDWLRYHEPHLVVDPVIIGEVRFGILLLPKGRRTRLERWFDAGVKRLICLPWAAETGWRWAELLASLRSSGRDASKGQPDCTSALVHNLIVATRNETDFEKAGVEVVNPFA